MFYEIQIDWNKTIILPMDKHTTAAVDAVFGTAMSVFRREYESGIGEGLTHDKDWKPVITVIRTEEFLARRNRSSEIAAKREAEKQGA